MKEKPILFSAPMIRAILDGTKTQTRRIVTPQPTGATLESPLDGKWLRKKFGGLLLPCIGDLPLECPYGQQGTNLWVRETWRTDASLDGQAPRDFTGWPVKYEADGEVMKHGACFGGTNGKTRVSIHMPRWASRINLGITGVRVERLNDISEADAQAEGTTPSFVGSDLDHLKYRAGFKTLWESINGPESWNANPWVWILEFRRTT